MLQQEVFAEEGVDLSRVVIGHSGDSSDLGYLEELLSRGSMIGMDRFGQLHHSPMGKRVEIVAEMCRRGWGGRMVFGHDADLYSDWSSESLDEHRRAARPLPFCRVSDEAIPALRKAGVTDEQITQMGVGNPRRIFETTRR
jgi:phosphotriesterase-related protein